jgi:hypothetical protein
MPAGWMDGSHRAGESNKVHASFLDERYVPVNYVELELDGMADGELPTHAKRSTCAKALWFSTPPRFPDSTRGVGSDLPFGDWWMGDGEVYGWWVMGGGWGRGGDEEGGREVMIVSMVLVSTAVCALV